MRKISCAVVGAVLAWGGHGEVIDLVARGAKNDGSADVSALINAETARGAIRLRAGVYRVEKPIWLKNPLVGEGYARVPRVDATRTWLVSAITNADASVGVINFGGDVRVNVENLNIRCATTECGIRIADCRQSTMTFLSKIGIFGLRGYGVYVKGRGSRPVFAQDMTVFGAAGHPSPCVGLSVSGPADCRLSNIEVMGARIGLEVFNGHTYGDNLHLWTGSMSGTDNGTWWEGTRGIVLGPGGKFSGSEIYPDTCFYAIEAKDDAGICEISNVMYWEDGSIRVAKNRDGAFFYSPSGDASGLVINGGLVGVGGTDKSPGWMNRVYTPGARIRDVFVKTDCALAAKNLDRLCFGSGLPDYTVRYADAGFCKVADVFTAAGSGACQLTLALQDGAAFRVKAMKPAGGRTAVAVAPLNDLAAAQEVKTAESDGLLKLYVRSATAAPMSVRVTTVYMGERFRPVDHGSLRDKHGRPRYREVRAAVD